MPMGKTSTFIYLYSNYEENELISEDLFDNDLVDFEEMLDFLDINTKKIPDSIVDQVIDFAKSYS